MKNRIEFNMHSNFSRMNGVNSAKEIFDRAKELGMDTIAITDIGSVKGLPEAYRHAKRQGIKLILGMEAFYMDGRIYCEAKNEDNFSRIIILAKNETGRKKLYKLISAYYKNGYAELTTRDGLLIGTNGINSEVIQSFVNYRCPDDVFVAVTFYDFILVDPMNYNEHVRHIVDLSDYTDALVIASNSPYYLKDEQATARAVLRFADGKDTDEFVDLSLFSTEDMLTAFDYLGDKAEDIVINNGYKLADMIEDDVPPIPHGTFRPNSVAAYTEIKYRALSKAAALYKINVTHYGYDLPELVKTRLETELEFIEKNGFEFNFFIPMEVAYDSRNKGYPVMSGYVAGSSFVAYLLGMTNVNPLKPHYRCDNCDYIEFVDGYESGFDLPAKKCPRCGRDLIRDGHNVPYETMFGFGGDKEPDIDLKLCEEYRIHCIDYLEKQFGKGVIRSGIYSSLHKKTAEYLVGDYISQAQRDISNKEKENITELCVGAFRKTGLNPTKFFITPSGYEIEDFTPIEIIEDDYFGRVAVTHYDCFNALHDTLLNIDVMGYDAVQMLKLLKEKTGVEPTENDIADNAEILKAIREGNTDSLHEMCTEYVKKMIEQIKPEKFSDYVAVSGLAHGTGVYEDNAKELFAEGVCGFESAIAFRENILLYLDKKRKEYTEKTGKEAPLSYLDCYKISEITRKGRAKRDLPEYEDALKDIGVPDWYIESMKKIKYLFPKAHSIEYMIASFKLLWYKLNYPNEFQEADYEVNGIVPTGFKKLDETLKGGFRKGDLCLIGARPGVGKTTFAIQLADFIADGYKKVTFFSLESPKKRLEEILYKQGTEPTLVEIDDTSAIDTDYIRNKLIETKADVAVIDYLGLFYASEKKNNRVAEASVIAYELRKIAEELNVAVIANLQISGDYGKQIHSLKHKCSLEGIRFSEQDANTILFLNRDNYYSNDRNSCSNSAQIIVAKNAYGNVGTVETTFDKVTMTFKEECEEKAT